MGNLSRKEAVGDTGAVCQSGTVDRGLAGRRHIVLDPSLLVIGRQVRTSFGGAVDLLCMGRGRESGGRRTQERPYSAGRHVAGLGVFVMGQEPGIRRNNRHRRFLSGSCRQPRDSLPGKIRGSPARRAQPGSSNFDRRRVRGRQHRQDRRILGGERSADHLVTLQHFEDANGRELLAQVYLIEPEKTQPRARRTSARLGTAR